MHVQENTSMSWVCKRRVRAIRHFVCGGFHMVTSAAVFGQGRVEIWIRQCLCDSKDIFVLHATARILLIRVSILRFRLHALFGPCVL